MKTIFVDPDNGTLQLEPSFYSIGSELQALLQLTQAVNNNLSSEGILKMFISILIKQLGINRLAIFLEEEGNWECRHYFGLAQEEYEDLDNRFEPEFRQIGRIQNHFFSRYFDFIFPVYHKDKPLLYTFLGDIMPRGEMDEHSKLNFIQVLSSIVAMALENKRLCREQRNQQALRSELIQAGELQTMLIPDNLPDNHRIQMSGVYSPHHEVGGDYYDYLSLNEDECMFCIGDISGKGVAAALLMANFQARLRSYADQYTSLVALVENLNTHVNNITKGEKYITFFLAKFNFVTRELQYVNAGHNPAILYHGQEIQYLEEGCTILGMFEKLPYVNVRTIHLPSPFVTFCYTDGLSDIENKKGKPLEIHHLTEFIKHYHMLDARSLNKKLMTYIQRFNGSEFANDDVSMLTCKIF
ncbi:MAG: serine/threonine-protein phosphatase [Chitinophagales bacterium]|nr:serine/threonine-protein phosphatase [Chitinophagales bacterium]